MLKTERSTSPGRLCCDELPPFDFPATGAGGGVEGAGSIRISPGEGERKKFSEEMVVVRGQEAMATSFIHFHLL
jgi:hypothetical protein